ncbi:MAG: threonine synthase [Bacteroidales bacterium]
MNRSTIKYFSTNLKAEEVSFCQALLKGLAPDKGLYMPDAIPRFTKNEIAELHSLEYHEIAFKIAGKFLENEIPENDLSSIVKDAYNFPVPLEKVHDRTHVLRLDQGPTASFKDFAARMMGRLMQYFLEREGRELLILTATSGDTGSAIANAFYGLDNIKVVVLFPENEVTPRQRKQMTTLRENVQIISIKGKFDDCQAMVKEAFVDASLEPLNLSSANSINIGRLIPQSMFYFYAWAKLSENADDKVIFSVPSGNFGDLMGGLIAREMGMPVKRFVVATNENDEVPVYFKTGDYQTIVPSRNCISSAMNVGHPSNMARIISLYGGIMNERGLITREPDIQRIRTDMFGVSVSDKDTRAAIKSAWDEWKLLLEPHGAVAWEGLKQYFSFHQGENHDEQLSIVLETAHPAKFPDEIQQILNIDPELPPSLSNLEDKEEFFVNMNNDYKEFRQFLVDKYSKS